MNLRRLFAILAALAFLGIVPATTTAGHAHIQPGADHNGGCTLNFVFDGEGALAGRVFIGTAGHCVDAVGERAWTGATGSFGTVVYFADDDENLDFALIEVDEAKHRYVSAEVRGHAGEPTGWTESSDTQAGDLVKFSGHGLVYGWTETTREGRMGVLVNDDAREYGVEGPILWGDSGGPVLTEDGRALGIVSRLGSGSCFGCDASWLVGPTIEGIHAELAAKGWPVRMRTV